MDDSFDENQEWRDKMARLFEQEIPMPGNREAFDEIKAEEFARKMQISMDAVDLPLHESLEFEL